MIYSLAVSVILMATGLVLFFLALRNRTPECPPLFFVSAQEFKTDLETEGVVHTERLPAKRLVVNYGRGRSTAGSGLLVQLMVWGVKESRHKDLF